MVGNGLGIPFLPFGSQTVCLGLQNGLPRFANGLPRFANGLPRFANGLPRFANLKWQTSLQTSFANLGKLCNPGWVGAALRMPQSAAVLIHGFTRSISGYSAAAAGGRYYEYCLVRRRFDRTKSLGILNAVA